MLKKVVEKFGIFIFVYIFVRSIRHNNKTNAMKTKELKSVNLKEGSIIELQFWINKNKQIQEDWTIVKIQNDDILYSANCVVSYVTDDFVKVILPETGLESGRYSKKRIDNNKVGKIVRI